jgi:hypothetical protein
MPLKLAEKVDNLDKESTKTASKKKCNTPRKQKASAEKEKAIASTLKQMGVLCYPRLENELI